MITNFYKYFEMDFSSKPKFIGFKNSKRTKKAKNSFKRKRGK